MKVEILSGHPGDAELAALAAALVSVPTAAAPDAEPSGWVRAALWEGIGGGPVASTADLDLGGERSLR